MAKKPYPSELRDLIARHRDEIEELRARCKHPQTALKLREDHSYVGRGTAYPSVHVICRNCGTLKVIFREHTELKRKVKKTLRRQGFKDERLDLYTQYEYELE